MAQQGRGIEFAIGLDLEKLRQQADEASRVISNIATTTNQTARKTEQSVNRMSDGFANLSRNISRMLKITSLGAFAKQVVGVTTQVEALEKSFGTLLGSMEKGQELTQWIKEFAAVTPLSISSLANASQTLLAFGVEAEKVTTLLKVLGDISGGNAERMNSLALAFAQMSSTGKLMGQDLLQMINAGFNPLQEISRKTGESVGSLKERMGEIPLQEIEDAFISATEAGGLFHGMLEKQAEGLAGAQARLKDAVFTQFLEIGDRYKDQVIGAFNAATDLVKALGKLVPIIEDIVVAYGSYKASIIAITALEKALQLLTMSRIQSLRLLITLQHKLNKAMKANPYGLVAGLIAGLATATFKWVKSQREASKETLESTKRTLEQVKALEERKGKIEELIGTIKDESKSTQEQATAYLQLKKLIPQLTEKYSQLDIAKMNSNQLTREAIELTQKEIKANIEAELERAKIAEKRAKDDYYRYAGSGYAKDPTALNAYANAYSQAQNSVQALEKQLKDITEAEEQANATLKEQVKNAKTRNELINEARANLANLRAEQKQLYSDKGKRTEEEWLKEIDRITQAIEKEEEKLEKYAGKGKAGDLQERQKQRKEQEQEEVRHLEDLYHAINRTTATLVEDTTQKRLALLEASHQQELAQLDRQQADLASKKRERGEELTNEEQQAYARLREATQQRYQQERKLILDEEQKKHEELLLQYSDYLQQRENIQAGATRKALDIQKASKETGQDPTPYLDQLKRETEEQLNQLDLAVAQKEASFTAWAKAMVGLSLSELEAELLKLEAEYSTIQGQGNAKQEQVAIARAKIAEARKQYAELVANEDYAPKEDAQKQWMELVRTLDVVSRQFGAIGDELSGVAGEMVKNAGEIASGAITMIGAIGNLVQSTTQATKTSAEGASLAIQTAEKASVILTIISATLQIATKIASLFDRDKIADKEIERLQGRIDQLQWELNNKEAIRITQVADPYERIADALKLAVQEQRKLVDLDKERAKNIRTYGLMLGNIITMVEGSEKITAQAAKNLTDAYAKLDYTVTKALGEDKFRRIRRDMENLAQQTILLERQRRQEQEKKKSNQSAIDSYNQGIRENIAKMRETLDRATEDIMGGSAGSVAERLGDAIVDAFRRGEDAAQSLHKTVNEIVSDILRRMMITKLVEEPIGKIFDRYQKEWFGKDGEWRGVEQLKSTLPQLSKDLTNAGDELRKALEALDPSLKNLLVTTEEASGLNREPSRRGITALSQDTGDEIAGRATAIQGHTFNIANNTERLVQTTNDILQHLAGIHSNTDSLRGIERDIREIRSDLQSGKAKVKVE